MTLGDVMRLVADHDSLARRLDLDMHLVNITGAMLAMQRFDGDAAGGDSSVELLEFGDALPDVCGKRGRRFHVVEHDLQRSIRCHARNGRPYATHGRSPFGLKNGNACFANEVPGTGDALFRFLSVAQLSEKISEPQ
jgi:hypothetical protein